MLALHFQSSCTYNAWPYSWLGNWTGNLSRQWNPSAVGCRTDVTECSLWEKKTVISFLPAGWCRSARHKRATIKSTHLSPVNQSVLAKSAFVLHWHLCNNDSRGGRVGFTRFVHCWDVWCFLLSWLHFLFYFLLIVFLSCLTLTSLLFAHLLNQYSLPWLLPPVTHQLACPFVVICPARFMFANLVIANSFPGLKNCEESISNKYFPCFIVYMFFLPWDCFLFVLLRPCWVFFVYTFEINIFIIRFGDEQLSPVLCQGRSSLVHVETVRFRKEHILWLYYVIARLLFHCLSHMNDTFTEF